MPVEISACVFGMVKTCLPTHNARMCTFADGLKIYCPDFKDKTEDLSSWKAKALVKFQQPTAGQDGSLP